MIHIENDATKSMMSGAPEELLTELVIAGASIFQALRETYSEDKAVQLMARATKMMLGDIGLSMTMIAIPTGGARHDRDS